MLCLDFEFLKGAIFPFSPNFSEQNIFGIKKNWQQNCMRILYYTKDIIFSCNKLSKSQSFVALFIELHFFGLNFPINDKMVQCYRLELLK